MLQRLRLPNRPLRGAGFSGSYSNYKSTFYEGLTIFNELCLDPGLPDGNPRIFAPIRLALRHREHCLQAQEVGAQLQREPGPFRHRTRFHGQQPESGLVPTGHLHLTR